MSPPSSETATLLAIVFSKDRPLQLHATLASLAASCQEPELLRARVVTYASDDEMAARYLQVAQEHPWAELIPESGFKPTLLGAARGARFLLLLVDDAVFVRPWSAAGATALLDRVPDAIGVSLRLGRNTTHCYSMDQPQQVPPLLPVAPGWLALEWPTAQHDFSYALEVSSSIYRAADLLPLLEALPYRNPNELEAQLSGQRAPLARTKPVLFCAEASACFCAPINMVQSEFQNRAGTRQDHSPAALARLFDDGMRVEVAALRGYTPRACHEEIELPLVRAAPPRPATPAPAVSVIIPCFRQAEFLSMAVRSLVVQTFTDWEVVIVDDGSDDDTAEVAGRLAAEFPERRIRLLRQANAGLANARNAGIQAARGRYLLPLDADDALVPTHLERTVAVLEGEPTVSIVGTDVAVFGARAFVWRLRRPFTVEAALAETPLPYASLYRREVWEAVGGYQANMSAGYEDWDFWVGAAERGFQARVLEEPLLLYREKGGSMLTAARQADRPLKARLVLNHPSHFDEASLSRARAILEASPLPPPKPATVAREVPRSGAAGGAPGSSPAAPTAPTAPAGPAGPAALVAPRPPEPTGPGAAARPRRIGFLLVATNRYAEFFAPLRESIRRHLRIPGAEPHFFCFSNVELPAAPDTTVLRIDHLPWPLITLLRYKIFLDHRAALAGMDYLYYLDVDCLFVDEVGPEILGRLVAVNHPGYYRSPRAAFTYETRAESRACIRPHEGVRYHAGGLQGGEREAFLELARSAHAAICDDLARNLIAVWHDESHLNRYLVDHPPTLVLDPSYLYPESWQLPLPRRIIALDKDHARIRQEAVAGAADGARQAAAP